MIWSNSPASGGAIRYRSSGSQVGSFTVDIPTIIVRGSSFKALLIFPRYFHEIGTFDSQFRPYMEDVKQIIATGIALQLTLLHFSV